MVMDLFMPYAKDSCCQDSIKVPPKSSGFLGPGVVCNQSVCPWHADISVSGSLLGWHFGGGLHCLFARGRKITEEARMESSLQSKGKQHWH